MGRLNKTVRRHRADGIGVDSQAVADLGRPAVVVPFGDMAKVQLFEAVSGTAQTQAYESRKAQTEATLPIGQDLRRPRLRRLPEITSGLGWKLDWLRLEIRNALVVEEADKISRLDGNLTAHTRCLPNLGANINWHHIGANRHTDDESADQRSEKFSPTSHNPSTPTIISLLQYIGIPPQRQGES